MKLTTTVQFPDKIERDWDKDIRVEDSGQAVIIHIDIPDENDQLFINFQSWDDWDRVNDKPPEHKSLKELLGKKVTITIESE